MKLKTLNGWSKTVLILCMLIQFYVIGQTESKNYQTFSNKPLDKKELLEVLKILPQAESYYLQNKTNYLIIDGQKEIIDSLISVVNKMEIRDNIRIESLLLKDKLIEEVKPKWWQHPTVIVIEVITALIIGFLLGK